jgi:hypothetical protein
MKSKQNLRYQINRMGHTEFEGKPRWLFELVDNQINEAIAHGYSNNPINAPAWMKAKQARLNTGWSLDMNEPKHRAVKAFVYIYREAELLEKLGPFKGYLEAKWAICGHIADEANEIGLRYVTRYEEA